jgi:Flp pilus assembly protein TadD
MCSPRARDAMKLLGFLFMQQGLPDRAVTLHMALAAHEPEDIGNVRALALALSRSGRHDQALEALDRLALSGAVDLRFHLLRSQTLSELGRTEEASAAMGAYLDALKAEQTTTGAEV